MTQLPYTGDEFLASLDDGREVWIYGERVRKVAEHPAFRNVARMLARLYDALHEDHTSRRGVLSTATEWSGFTHRYFKAPTSSSEQLAARDAIAGFARLSFGWLGRSPDYKAAFLATLGAHAEFYAPRGRRSASGGLAATTSEMKGRAALNDREILNGPRDAIVIQHER